jgi:hypothetical protein
MLSQLPGCLLYEIQTKIHQALIVTGFFTVPCEFRRNMVCSLIPCTCKARLFFFHPLQMPGKKNPIPYVSHRKMVGSCFARTHTRNTCLAQVLPFGVILLHLPVYPYLYFFGYLIAKLKQMF